MLYDEVKARIEELPGVTWKRMFGWECAMVGEGFFGGLKEEDQAVRFFLRVDKELHDKLQEEFPELYEFDFGHWLEGEINSIQDIETFFPAIKQAYEFTSKIRENILPKTSAKNG